MDRFAKTLTAATVAIAAGGIFVGEAWAADDAAKPAPAAIAWGAATNELQAGLVPLGGVPGDRWGEGKDLFFCPKCANKPRKACMDPSVAADKRVCAVCQAPKPWSATFIEGEPMRMELHVRNLDKEARSLYDAGYPEHWRFTFTPCIRGTSWQASYAIEARRKVESIEECTIRIAAGQQNAVELDLGAAWMFTDPQGRQPATHRLPAGKYTVTATYAHPEHEQAKPCPYWHGTVTTGPVVIEIKPNDAMTRFLDAAKYAGFAAVAEVKALPQAGDGDKPAQLGIAWKDLIYAPDAARPAMTKVTALALPYLKPGVADDKATAGLKVGDKILVVVDERTVNFRVRSDNGRALLTVWLEGAQWLPWSQSRQDALASVLAPGWQESACPWCRRHGELFEGVRLGSCRVCEKEGIVGWLCITCARQLGECSAPFGNCKRTIGPATRDVTFRLWAFDPNAERDGTPRNECRIQSGAKSLPLWVEVRNEKGETPEFQTPGGGARFDCCKTFFYLVEGPGLDKPSPVFHGDGDVRGRMMAPAALQKGSACGQVQLMGGDLFAKPGAYTVRAVAGRLVSNPLTVIVEPETEAQREAMPQAAPPAPVAQPVVVKEGVVELPAQPRSGSRDYSIATLCWSPAGDSLLAGYGREYIEGAAFVPPPFFRIAAADAKPEPLSRAISCGWLADGRLLAAGAAPLAAPDLSKLKATAGQFEDKGFAILASDGKLAAGPWKGCGAFASADGKRLAVTQAMAGRNNWFCYRRITVVLPGVPDRMLTPPVAERAGRLVGFQDVRWDGERLLATVVDMERASAEGTPPGKWMTEPRIWYGCDPAQGDWIKLEGTALADAQATRIPLGGGIVILVKPDRIERLAGAERQSIEWPGLNNGQDAMRELREGGIGGGAGKPGGESPDAVLHIANIMAVSAEGGRVFLRVLRVDPDWRMPPGGATKAGPPDAGFFLVDFATKKRIRVDLDSRSRQPEAQKYWRAAYAFLEDGRLLVVEDGGAAALTVEPDGSVSALNVAGFTWPAWILSDATYPRRGATTPDGGNLWYADALRPMDLMDLGGGRAALLVREGNFVKTPHALVVFLRKDQARVLQAPAGFQLGQYSRMAWSPDGQALAVSEHEGRRVWVVKPERIAADEPTKTTGPAGTEVF